MVERVKIFTYKLESSFLLTVIRHGLAMMIPFILTGGLASAIMALPIPAYQSLIRDSYFVFFLNTVYTGTFGMFSLAMLISLSASYCMERNMTVDETVMYILVSLGSFTSQIYSPSTGFNVDILGVQGSFFAIITALISCYALESLRRLPQINLQDYTFGMERITAISISMLLPACIVISLFILFTQFILAVFGVASLFELISGAMSHIFDYIQNEFTIGLIYTFLIHLLWSFGLHGSHILESVSQPILAIGSTDTIFSRSFFDVYIVMGGCGTTIAALIAILIFFRKTRMQKLAKIASVTVIFNINELLTFGIPIVLNPILVIPFITTPLVCFTIAYVATYFGIVPPVIHDVTWSTPIIFSGYMATDSIRGSILQVVMVIIGIAIYTPFLKLHLKAQDRYAKEQMDNVIKFMQEKEELNENIDLLSQSSRMGQMSRMLRHDLRSAIEKDELYLLFQPQVDSDGKCIGAEALLRWEHPLYGFIYPPLIIYLAKEGGLLESLEKRIITKTVSAIADVDKECGPDFKISMNLTAKSLLWNIEDYIDSTLKTYNVSPSQLWIEITEQDVLSKAAIVIKKLEHLKAKGHIMMIDDFGMGHTSILYLQSSHFGVVKLDGALVKELLDSPTNQQIISSIVSLANSLGINVIAEYVEEEKQRDKLLELGCKWYQGYLYDRPIPLENFIKFMKEHQ